MCADDYEEYDDYDHGPPQPYKPIEKRKSLRKLLSNDGAWDYYGFIYNMSSVDDLASKHKLQGLEEDLELELKRAADVYYKFGPYNYSPYQDHPEILKYVKKMRQLVASLEGEMWIAPDFLFDGAIEALNKNGLKPNPVLGLSGWATPIYDRFMRQALRRQLTAFDELLKNVSERVAKKITVQRGRPREHTEGLEAFVFHLAEFWTHHAKRKFTASLQNGGTKSPAVLFIADALFLLDKIPMQAVLTAARAVRSKMKNGE
jgi:hypothetical protein